MNTSKENIFESANLLVFLFKWKKPLIIISLSAAIISAVVSLLIEPKFKSTVVLFPASTSSLSKALIAENDAGKHDIMAFGEEEEAEQMLQILNSDEIRNRIIKKYNLLEHYDLKESEEFVKTKLNKKYENNISFKRTEFQSVKIDVLDKDPLIAANIANDIAALVDSVKNRMQRERTIKALAIVEAEYVTSSNYIKSLEDSMTTLRKIGVHEYEVQIEMYTEMYSRAIFEGKTKSAQDLEVKLKVLAEHGSAYVSLRNKLEYETEKFTVLRAKYQEIKMDAEAEIPHKFIVNNAFPAERKSYPIRWLIVVVSTVSAFLVGVVGVIVLENYKKYIS